jgi:gamma-glutamylaminecyclotransferase
MGPVPAVMVQLSAMMLFVYGTLRSDQPAHGLLRGARLVARARTEPRFTLVEMDGYPALVEGGGTSVAGEIYEVDEAVLSELDRYEDVPQIFQRETLRIAEHEVWVYVLPPQHAAGRPSLPSGDWCDPVR